VSSGTGDDDQFDRWKGSAFSKAVEYPNDAKLCGSGFLAVVKDPVSKVALQRLNITNRDQLDLSFHEGRTGRRVSWGRRLEAVHLRFPPPRIVD
jgi:hypothetical protein